MLQQLKELTRRQSPEQKAERKLMREELLKQQHDEKLIREIIEVGFRPSASRRERERLLFIKKKKEKGAKLEVERKRHDHRTQREKLAWSSAKIGYDGSFVSEVIKKSVERVCNPQRTSNHTIPAEDRAIIDKDKDKDAATFCERLLHPHKDNIPLLSQTPVKAVHDTKKKKLIAMICRRLRNDDKDIVRLRLAGYQIDDNFLNNISKAVSRNHNTRELLLYNNFITDAGIRELCRSLRAHFMISVLSLGGNLISDVGATELAKLMGQNKRIKLLNLANRWPRSRWTDAVMLRHPRVTSIGAKYLAERLWKGCGLVSLSLMEQRIGDDGESAIFDSLPRSHLRTLNLDKNELTDACCRALCATLQKPIYDEDKVYRKGLQVLSLKGNAISDEGAFLICDGLLHNQTLKVLNISKNQIGDEGAAALFHMLAANTTLTSLSSEGNNTEDNRAEKLCLARAKGEDVSEYMSMLEETFLAAAEVEGEDDKYWADLEATLDDEENDDDDDGDDGEEVGRTNTNSSSSPPHGSPGDGYNHHHHHHHPNSSSSEGAVSAVVNTPTAKRRRNEAAGTTARSRSRSRSSSPARPDGEATVPPPSALKYTGSMKWTRSRLTRSGTAETDLGVTTSTNSTTAGLDAPFNFESFAQLSLSPTSTADPHFWRPSSPPWATNDSVRTGIAGSSTTGSLSPLKANSYLPGDKAGSVGLNLQQKQLFAATSGGGTAAHPYPHPMSPGGTQLSSPPRTVSSLFPAHLAAEKKGLSSTTDTGLAAARSSSSLSKRYEGPLIPYPGLPIRESREKGANRMPVRSVISPYHDSMQHTVHLRMTTPYDPPGTEPYSVVLKNVERDQQIEAVKAERQTQLYKFYKHDKITLQKKTQGRQQAAMKPPPNSFKHQWDHRMQKLYPDGIDRAKGVVSIKHDPKAWVIKYNPEMIDRLRNGDTKALSGPRKLVQIRTDKDALEQRRLGILVAKEQEKQALSTLKLQDFQVGGTIADGTEVMLDNGKVVKTRFSNKNANAQKDCYENVVEAGLTVAQQGALVFKFNSHNDHSHDNRTRKEGGNSTGSSGTQHQQQDYTNHHHGAAAHDLVAISDKDNKRAQALPLPPLKGGKSNTVSSSSSIGSSTGGHATTAAKQRRVAFAEP